MCISTHDGSRPLHWVVWQVLKKFNHLLQRSKKVDFIEQFNSKLLVKQEGENLMIVDVHSCTVVSVSKTEFVTPSAFIFLVRPRRRYL